MILFASLIPWYLFKDTPCLSSLCNPFKVGIKLISFNLISSWTTSPLTLNFLDPRACVFVNGKVEIVLNVNTRPIFITSIKRQHQTNTWYVSTSLHHLCKGNDMISLEQSNGLFQTNMDTT